MGIFDDDTEDIASAVGFEAPPVGTWAGVVSDAGTQTDKNEINNLVIEYSVNVEGKTEPMKYSEWLKIPKGKRSDWDFETVVNDKGHTQGNFNEWALAALKTRLLSLGIPEQRLNTVNPENLIGHDVVVTFFKDKGDYTKVKRVVLANKPSRPAPALPSARPAAVASTVTVANPFAKKD